MPDGAFAIRSDQTYNFLPGGIFLNWSEYGRYSFEQMGKFAGELCDYG